MKKRLQTERNKLTKIITSIDRDITYAEKVKKEAGNSDIKKLTKQILKLGKYTRKKLVKKLAEVELLLK